MKLLFPLALTYPFSLWPVVTRFSHFSTLVCPFFASGLKTKQNKNIEFMFPTVLHNKRMFYIEMPQTISWSQAAFQIKTEVWWNGQQVWLWAHLKLGHLFSKGSSYIRSLLPGRRYQRAGEKALFFHVTQDRGGEGGFKDILEEGKNGTYFECLVRLCRNTIESWEETPSFRVTMRGCSLHWYIL